MDTKDYDMIFVYTQNWNNDRITYNNLINLHHQLYINSNKKILINLEKVQFISANLLAILGCILDSAIIYKKHSIIFANIHPKVKVVMQKNGFNKYLRWEGLEDIYHSSIEYKIFDATTERLEEFEKFILMNVFARPELPYMTTTVRDRIIDNILEMFNNVIDHSFSEKVYVCGQYFHKSKSLVFSIVDFGKTVKENVNDFLADDKLQFKTALEWAIIPGNSTKSQSAPGGLGLSILLDFINLNQGCFTLISDNECFEVNNNGERFIELDNKFHGTIVTITINLKDDFAYILNSNEEINIVF